MCTFLAHQETYDGFLPKTDPSISFTSFQRYRNETSNSSSPFQRYRNETSNSSSPLSSLFLTRKAEQYRGMLKNPLKALEAEVQTLGGFQKLWVTRSRFVMSTRPRNDFCMDALENDKYIIHLNSTYTTVIHATKTKILAYQEYPTISTYMKIVWCKP